MSALRLSGALVWLTVLWVMLWHDLSVANVLGGLLVGGAVLAFARLPRVVRVDRDDRPQIRPVAVARLVAHLAYDLVRANVVVAREVLARRTRINQGIVAVPLRTDSEVAAMAVVGVINLTPGTVAIDVLDSPHVVYVHVLHVDDLETVRRDLMRLEELFVDAFGSRRARAQVAGVAAEVTR